MKLAYVLNTYPQPSHSFIRRELRALEAQGHDVVRIAMRRSDQELVDPQDREEATQTTYVLDHKAALLADVTKTALSRPGKFLSALRLVWRMGRVSEPGVFRHLIYLAEAAHVARLCTEAGVEHAHAHFGTNPTAVALLAHELGGARYSFTTHGPEEFDAPRALSLGLKLEHAAFAVGVSQFGRSQLRRWVGFEIWPKLHVVHCGIDPEKFDDPAPVPDDTCRVVAIGRFVEQKGQMVLIEAMSAAIDRNPELHLTLVGDGPMRNALQTAVTRLGLEKNVRFTGWLDERRILQELEAAQALVMPSFAEGLPMVIMEAMAAARPVIATSIAGVPELVQQNKTGWLIPAGDVGALSDALTDLAATPVAALAEMGASGRKRVLARHDAGVEAAKLAALIAKAGQSSTG
ncbi:glycosyltransferase family 4 protein [Primorskyibacter sp. S87]|uniref:glycosyltransferase family 4 protein n=1 Tax=Primorskyibacter sp. S87 TaxID=3415126 RepID=UPI003C7D5B52